MKKWLVMLMMLLAMAGSAEARQVLPNISYRYYKNGTWSGWQTRSLTSDSAQCLVFRDAWYYIKGYPFT